MSYRATSLPHARHQDNLNPITHEPDNFNNMYNPMKHSPDKLLGYSGRRSRGQNVQYTPTSRQARQMEEQERRLFQAKSHRQHTPTKPKGPRKVQSQAQTMIPQPDNQAQNMSVNNINQTNPSSGSSDFKSPDEFREKIYKQERDIQELEKRAEKEKIDRYKDALDQMVEQEKVKRHAEEVEYKSSPRKDDQLWDEYLEAEKYELQKAKDKYYKALDNTLKEKHDKDEQEKLERDYEKKEYLKRVDDINWMEKQLQDQSRAQKQRNFLEYKKYISERESQKKAQADFERMEDLKSAYHQRKVLLEQEEKRRQFQSQIQNKIYREFPHYEQAMKQNEYKRNHLDNIVDKAVIEKQVKEHMSDKKRQQHLLDLEKEVAAANKAQFQRRDITTSYDRNTQVKLQKDMSRAYGDAVQTEMLIKADEAARKQQQKEYQAYLQNQMSDNRQKRDFQRMLDKTARHYNVKKSLGAPHYDTQEQDERFQNTSLPLGINGYDRKLQEKYIDNSLQDDLNHYNYHKKLRNHLRDQTNSFVRSSNQNRNIRSRGRDYQGSQEYVKNSQSFWM